MHRIIIATPSARDPSWDYVLSLQAMMWPMIGHGGAAYRFCPVRSSLLIEGRHQIVVEALKDDATHILWLDDDMRFPPETLAVLLLHDKPIVGCNCPRRSSPVKPTATRGGNYVYSNGKTGLEEVETIGLAVMLTKTEVFREIPQPWFATAFAKHSPEKKYIGEDVFFCGRARERGYPILIDHGLSQKIGHTGPHAFTHDMITVE